MNDYAFRPKIVGAQARLHNSRAIRRRLAQGLAAAALLMGVATAPSFAAGKSNNSASILPGGNSKEPISIAADKLNYFDKEQKAIYTGNVVVIQGDSKLTCSVLTIFLAKNETAPTEGGSPSVGPAATPAAASSAPADAGGSAPGAGTSQVKHMDAAGPVSIVSKTQVATGDRGEYDKAENKVWLYGNVTLSDSGNVTKGGKLTYDLATGHAVVENGRVTGVFVPASNDNSAKDKSAPAQKKVP